MASYRSFNVASGSVAGTTGITVTKPSGVADGDVLVAFCAAGDDLGGAYTCSGFTQASGTGSGAAATTVGNDIGTTVLFKYISNAAGEPASYTFVNTDTATQNRAVTLVCVQGPCRSSDPIDELTQNTGTNDWTPTHVNITTGVDNAVVLFFHAGNTGTAAAKTAGAPATPSGTTLIGTGVRSRTTGNYIECESAYYLAGAAGAITVGAWTGTADDTTSEWHVYSVSIAPVAAVVVTKDMPDLTVSVNDRQDLSRYRNRGMPDLTVALNDERVKTSYHTRQLSEALTMYDSNIQLIRELRRGDTVNVTDPAFRLSVQHYVTASSFISLTDDFIKVISGGGGPTIYEITLSDGTVITDGLLVTRYRDRQFVDLLNVNDGQFISRQRGRFIPDEIASLADSMYLARVRGKLMGDSADPTDSQYLSRLRGRVMLDNVTVTDQQLAYRLFFRLLTDTVNLTDDFISSVFGGTVFQITLSDVVTVADQILVSRYRNRSFVDPLTLIDQTLAYRLFYRLPTDTTTITDDFIKSIVGGTTITITLSDAIAVADAFNVARYRNRNLVDPVAVIDELIVQRRRNRGPFTDNITLSDGNVLSRERVKHLSESLAITDQQLRFLLRTLQASDTIGVTDNLLTFRLRSRDLIDSLSVFDRFDRSIIGVIVPVTVEVRVRLNKVTDTVLLGQDASIRLAIDDSIKLGGYN